ncbi:hypothetical protein WICPIJ_007717 [Wickerhamomyces pijperi]|uniref:Uncharacterized protein n=1 Tax=Wickerhamomyces pijperi TaxID=599730 RepID=A0A9P8Q191_WICPI|nr:hypothetical protein WICPIJ_007717 [Wickerhamomyces pijperi]
MAISWELAVSCSTMRDVKDDVGMVDNKPIIHLKELVLINDRFGKSVSVAWMVCSAAHELIQICFNCSAFNESIFNNFTDSSSLISNWMADGRLTWFMYTTEPISESESEMDCNLKNTLSFLHLLKVTFSSLVISCNLTVVG